MTVYKGIAPGEDRKALPPLDINSRRLADGLLQLAFSLSQQVGQDGVVSLWTTLTRQTGGCQGGRGRFTFFIYSY
jgi:hypothetical protein